MFFERFDKKIIEKFALQTISKSFNYTYGEFILPNDTDNFDAVSLDNSRALEVTIAVAENNMKGYVYEKEFSKGKPNLNVADIKNAELKPSGELLFWHGGTIQELVLKIQTAVIKKDEKARKRLATQPHSIVDLCICIADGALLDFYSFLIMDLDLDSTVFENYFFITSKLFIRYSKESGFEQYQLTTA